MQEWLFKHGEAHFCVRYYRPHQWNMVISAVSYEDAQEVITVSDKRPQLSAQDVLDHLALGDGPNDMMNLLQEEVKGEM